MELPEESEKSDVEKLALLRAKKRVDSWSEQAKSPWMWLGFLLGFAGLPTLIALWAGAFIPNSVVGLREAIASTLLAAVAVCLLWMAQNAWKKKQILRHYEIELLELEVGKHD